MLPARNMAAALCSEVVPGICFDVIGQLLFYFKKNPIFLSFIYYEKERMDEVVNKKWKWIAAIVLCAVVLVGVQLQERGQIAVDIKGIVYSSEDLTIMRNLLREVFGEEPDKKITVSTESVNVELLSFVAAKPYDNGYLLTFEHSIPILAIENGLVVYTGHTKNTGKTISVYYEDDTTVTYGYLDSFSLLPYTSIERGSPLANKKPGDLYIKIENGGKVLNMEQTLEWMKEHTQS
ncbi:M23 family peptidase [Lysinibacillus yapensis]|uniref:M23 family peptidase n=1 Tax=Ureibacillus yapensis TaxID=2304605 RepID=A0A396SHX5_9BACL|nr:M23 family metallopeptidase [Lysinibacillus yapensis]RHW38677.1 M23 family peptidase [Lysinibacillus yapensis]